MNGSKLFHPLHQEISMKNQGNKSGSSGDNKQSGAKGSGSKTSAGTRDQPADTGRQGQKSEDNKQSEPKGSKGGK
jgi:hypothetical protein